MWLVCLANCGNSPRGGSSGGGSPDASDPCNLARATTQVPDDAGTGSCTFSLGMPPNSNYSNQCVHIFIDGLAISHDVSDADGWDYADPSHMTIQLYGSACATAQDAATAVVTMAYYCCGVA